ncbi:flavin-containing monooxygenase [Aaosphaeria arxii CBS 175.79]|uniref:Flavin-containing monooxygenase n=1 Tax=Aaosphaeria arxii CBS 175.79 TaxID=1450172 RepID=A0A6A5Y7Z7_9PLEO|nr:flavin-containing monooxygenase [Aaosphaeria arxii CBS 175.79]KAF2021363.1 flavin-containing monooxygenase [Aaosphaeria arxii CBS 175.79]
MTSIRVKSIAIIGGGPSGVVAAKYLRAEKAFDKITIFEQRSALGGTWHYTPNQTSEDLFAVPQIDPKGGNQDPTWTPAQKHEGKEADSARKHNDVASFLTPIYEELETNVPKSLMQFQDLQWPDHLPLFPSHGAVVNYLQEHGREVQDLVEYETQVIKVEPLDKSLTGSWTVTTRNLRTREEKKEVFDAVIVANGHFITPHVPDVPGIREWSQKYPGRITHSKYFRRAESYAGKKVVVVGNSASGVDISAQLVSVTEQPIIWSIRSASQLKPLPDPQRPEYSKISKFVPDDGSIHFDDGRIEHDVDAIIFATGYYYSLPFLSSLKPQPVGDGRRVQHTYKHLFYAPRPTLSFLALNVRGVPFTLAEAQSAVLSRVYSGRLALPPSSELLEWDVKALAAHGRTHQFHVLDAPTDGLFINEMAAWALKAERVRGLENNGQGRLAPVWGPWEFWCRANLPGIRAAFSAKGEGRTRVREIEELGAELKGASEAKRREAVEVRESEVIVQARL